MRHWVISISVVVAVTIATMLCFVSSMAHELSTELLYTKTNRYDASAWMNGGERFPSGASIEMLSGNRVHPLAHDFYATADANVSFDGRRVLFSGKHERFDYWQVWEINVIEGDVRRVVTTDSDTVRPLYLPGERLVYARKSNGQFVLESATLTGTDVVQLTYASGNALPSDVLLDGRILFEAGYPLGTGTTPDLYTVYPDGSGVEAYRCDHARARYGGRQIRSGDIVFSHGSSLARFTSASAKEVAVAAPKGEYAGDIMETADGAWLVSRRGGGSSAFELQLWMPGSGRLDRFFAEAGTNLVQPSLVTARSTPNRFPSGLHEWPTANLLMLSSYLSKYSFATGSVKTVRGYARTATGTRRFLGTAPVEKDGSFFVRVQGDEPIQFELLDAKNRVLQKQKGWFWARRGEQRICVGCHAGPQYSPENAVPATLERTVIPADFTRAKHAGGR